MNVIPIALFNLHRLIMNSQPFGCTFALVKIIFVFLIRVYQYGLSPLLGGSKCRYSPSCSEYAREAIVKHGSLKGSWLALKRIARCAPWGSHGYDPVP